MSRIRRVVAAVVTGLALLTGVTIEADASASGADVVVAKSPTMCC